MRQKASVMLVTVLLFSNGYIFVPWMGVGIFHEAQTKTMCQCCCAHAGDMSCPCCRAAHLAAMQKNGTCSISSSPCSTPVVTLSPNVLDPAVEFFFVLSLSVEKTQPVQYSAKNPSLLAGTRNLPFHPPQSPFSLS
ncbi:MAG TPA: hypothetical protein VMM58_11945 [Bacteroidota bacterium]|nr:hypothetical protein [Bacteroidota bacterium]